MLDYLIKFSLCLLVLYLFYKLFLERESIHRFKRFYLLLSIITAGVIPLLVFSSPAVSGISPMLSPLQYTSYETFETSTGDNDKNYILWLFAAYLAGVLIMGIRYAFNLWRLYFKIRSNQNIKHKRGIKVLLEENIAPYTFLKYIFLNREKYISNKIPREVIVHEETHAAEKHSLDLLFIELLQVILWFHPLPYLIKHSIKLNHEFLADSAVIRTGINQKDYWNTLISYSKQKYQPGMANAINYSSIKKRLKIMKKQTSKRAAGFRYLLLLPIVCLLTYSFSERVRNTPIDTLAIQQIQDGVSDEMVEEYNMLARKYNVDPQDHTLIKSSELERMSYIYRKMTQSQRNAAEPLPKFATPPEPPEAAMTPSPSSESEHADLVPPPPPPPAPPSLSPVEFIQEMDGNNAKFYYKGKSISAAEAIKIVKHNKNLHIATKASHTNPPEVFISKKGKAPAIK